MDSSKFLSSQKDTFISKFILLLLVIQLIVLPIRIDDYQFLIFSIGPLIYILANLFDADRFPIRIAHLDLAWLLFCSWGFCSLLWATNSSLVWFYAFGWLTMMMWMILIRSLFEKLESSKILFSFFQSLFVLFLFYYFFFFLGKMLQNRIVIDTSTGMLNDMAIIAKLPIGQYKIHTNGPDFWNLIFGYNCNVTALYAVLLLPFILFYEFSTSINNIIKYSSIAVVTLLLYQASSIGVFIAFAILLGYYLWNLQLANYVRLFTAALGGAFMFFLMIYFYDSNLIQHAPIIKELTSLRDGGRYLTVVDAGRIFTEKPILGSGLGNWLIDAHKHYLTSTEYGSHIFPINHVIYSLILAELGIVGFGIFISILVHLLYINLKIGRQLVPIKKAALGSFMVYIVALLFYNGAISKPLFFCKAQVIAFCAIGILTFDRRKIIQLSLWHQLLFLLLGFGSCVWFTYTLVTNKKYASISKKEKVEYPQKAYNKLIEIYNPIFKTDYGRNESLSFELAQLAIHKEDSQAAKKYFQQAIKENNNNENILIGYANFLLRNDTDLINAEKYISLARAIKKDNLSVQISTVELAIEGGKYSDAKNGLDTIIFPNEPSLLKKLLEIKLYSSGYIEEIIQLSVAQNSLLDNSRIRQNDFQKLLREDLIRLEALMIYPNKEAIDSIEKRFFGFYQEMEQFYFKNFTVDQFRLYLLDKYRKKVAYLSEDFSVELNLSEEQKLAIYDFLLESRMQRKILKLQIETEQDASDSRQQKLQSVMKAGSMHLKKILTTQQYKRYLSLSKFNSNNVDALLF